jgi:hypothetical protein
MYIHTDKTKEYERKWWRNKPYKQQISYDLCTYILIILDTQLIRSGVE